MSAADFVLIGLAALAAGVTVYLVIQAVRADRNVAASQAQQAHKSSPKGESTDTGIAPDEVHGLPAPGNARTQMADRAPSASVAGRADDDSELRSVALILPMVQESMQPSGRRQARCRCNEPQATADGQDEQGLEALVIAEHAVDEARALLAHANVTMRGSTNVRELDELATSYLMLANTSREIAELRRSF